MRSHLRLTLPTSASILRFQEVRTRLLALLAVHGDAEWQISPAPGFPMTLHIECRLDPAAEAVVRAALDQIVRCYGDPDRVGLLDTLDPDGRPIGRAELGSARQRAATRHRALLEQASTLGRAIQESRRRLDAMRGHPSPRAAPVLTGPTERPRPVPPMEAHP
jgi:hypothetical protein